MDPVKRMFAELREQNPTVRIRYHSDGKADHVEKTLPYVEYQVWLANAPSNGFVLEWCQMISKGAT